MFCGKVKEFLSQKGVKYTERDVSKDPEAIDELRKMGIMTTPVVIVDSEVIVGFDENRLNELIT